MADTLASRMLATFKESAKAKQQEIKDSHKSSSGGGSTSTAPKSSGGGSSGSRSGGGSRSSGSGGSTTTTTTSTPTTDYSKIGFQLSDDAIQKAVDKYGNKSPYYVAPASEHMSGSTGQYLDQRTTEKPQEILDKPIREAAQLVETTGSKPTDTYNESQRITKRDTYKPPPPKYVPKYLGKTSTGDEVYETPYKATYEYTPNDPDYKTIKSNIKQQTGNLDTAIKNLEIGLAKRKTAISNVKQLRINIAQMELNQNQRIEFKTGDTVVESFPSKTEALSYLDTLEKEYATIEFYSIDKAGKKVLKDTKTIREAEEYYSDLRSKRGTITSHLFDIQLYEKGGWEVDIKDSGLEFKLPSAIDVHSALFKDKGLESIALTSASFLESPLAIKTFGTGVYSFITGDKKATETRHKELVQYSLGLQESIKKGEYGFKVMSSPAMIYGVYIPTATMGVGYAFQGLGVAAASGGKALQAFNLGVKGTGFALGGASLGYTAAQISMAEPERRPGLISETAFTFGLAAGGFKAGRSFYQKNHPTIPATETYNFISDKGKFYQISKGKDRFTFSKIQPIKDINNVVGRVGTNQKGFNIYDMKATGTEFKYYMQGKTFYKIPSMSKLPFLRRITFTKYFEGTATSTEMSNLSLQKADMGFITVSDYWSSSFKRLVPFKVSHSFFKPTTIAAKSLSTTISGSITKPGKFGLTSMDVPDTTVTYTKGFTSKNIPFSDKSYTFKLMDLSKPKAFIDTGGSAGLVNLVLPSPTIQDSIVLPGGLTSISSSVKYPIWSVGASSLLIGIGRNTKIIDDFDYEKVSTYWQGTTPSMRSTNILTADTKSDLNGKSITGNISLNVTITSMIQDIKNTNMLKQESGTSVKNISIPSTATLVKSAQATQTKSALINEQVLTSTVLTTTTTPAFFSLQSSFRKYKPTKSYFTKYKSYRFRKWKVPTMEDFLKGGKW